MGLFPVILSYALISWLFLRRGFDRREAILAASVVCGTNTVILTEFLSVLHQIDAAAVNIGWWLSACASAFFLLTSPKVHSNNSKHTLIPVTAKIFMACIFFIFLALAFLAIGYAPNTWDALTYHLPRVEHWVQNRTITYYPTHIPRQDAYPPWAEWGLLHLRLLSGGDHFAGSLQCLSMMVSTIGVSLIARWLGAGVTGQSLAALLSACLPMGILQATSTQNDYVLTMWFVSFVYFLLNFIRSRRNLFLFLSALSLGLAFLTKGYAYVYALPFVLWYLLATAPRPWLYRIATVLILIGVALLLNTGYFYRNWHAFGSLLWDKEHLITAKLSPGIGLANLLRNSALHLGTIYVPYNEWVTNRLQDLAALLHIDLNPAQGSFSTQKFEVPSLMFYEDYAGNFLSVLIFIVILIIAGIKFFQGRRGLQWAYAWAVAGMFLLLCLLLRFQVFNSRFHLAIFVLGSAWTAFVMEKLFARKWLLVTGLFVLITAVPWFLFNNNKPLSLGLNKGRNARIEEYFITSPSWVEPIMGLSLRLGALHCGNIGLISGEDSKEYLLWAALRRYKFPLSRLEHVDVLNPTGHLAYPLGEFNPCALVILSAQRPSMITLPAGIYSRVWVFGNQQGDVKGSLYVPLH